MLREKLTHGALECCFSDDGRSATTHLLHPESLRLTTGASAVAPRPSSGFGVSAAASPSFLTVATGSTKERTRASFGPMPGTSSSDAVLRGTRPPNDSSITLAALMIRFALTLCLDCVPKALQTSTPKHKAQYVRADAEHPQHGVVSRGAQLA